MALYLAVVTLAKKSGIPADAVQNTFAFERTALEPPVTAGAAIKAALDNFYNTAGAGGSSVGSQLAESLSTTADAGRIQVYDVTADLGGTAHGSPVYDQPFTLSNTGVGSLPDEVAACLSFQSAYGADVEFGAGARPRARDRGRVFIGPLRAGAAVVDATTKEAFLAQTTRIAIAEAGGRLVNMGAGWSVWSRRDAAFKTVISGWVDNAFDVQRRRGNEANLRTLWDESGIL